MERDFKKEPSRTMMGFGFFVASKTINEQNNKTIIKWKD
jgi:hypothetical protein